MKKHRVMYDKPAYLCKPKNNDLLVSHCEHGTWCIDVNSCNDNALIEMLGARYTTDNPAYCFSSLVELREMGFKIEDDVMLKMSVISNLTESRHVH